MKTTISNTDSLIDSRDIIDRIEELTELIAGELTPDDFLEATKEYDDLITLQEECEGVEDWNYGVTLIHENYFEQYIDEMLEDCGKLPKNLPFYINIIIDYDVLKQDYTEVDFNGETYYVQ